MSSPLAPHFDNGARDNSSGASQYYFGIPVNSTRLRRQGYFYWHRLRNAKGFCIGAVLMAVMISVACSTWPFFVSQGETPSSNRLLSGLRNAFGHHLNPLEVPVIYDVEYGLTPYDWDVRWLNKDLKWTEDAILGDRMDFLSANCDFISYHTGTSKYLDEKKDDLMPLLKAEAEWMSYQFLGPETSRIGTCLLILSNRTELPRFHQLHSDMVRDNDEIKDSMATDKFKSRFHGGLALDQVARYRVEQGYDSYLGGKYPLFGNYHDFDVFYTNKSKTYEALLARIDRGVKRFHNGGDTTETRLCREWHKIIDEREEPMDWVRGYNDTQRIIDHQGEQPANKAQASLPPKFPCHWQRIEEMRKALKSVADIAVVSAFDNYIDFGWLLNGGVTMYQLGTPTAKYVLEAVLSIINTQRIKHAYDRSDQGKLTYVLNQSAVINFDILPYIDKWAGNEIDILGPSTDGDEIIILGMMDIEMAKRIPHFKYAAEHWERDHPTRRDAMGVAIVSPKWMNSPACRHSLKWAWRHRSFTCGDMAGHFNGCGKGTYEDFLIRKKCYLECSGSNDFPAKTNNDGSPFTWEKFLRETRWNIDENEISLLLNGTWPTTTTKAPRKRTTTTATTRKATEAPIP